MANDQHDITLAELLIVACAEGWRGDGELLASGIGTIPRLAAGLAKLTHSPELLLTDGEAYLIEEPIPLGPRPEGFTLQAAGWMPFARIFECVWGGYRHALTMPSQIDRYGQTNISCLGADYDRPKTQLLGARGYPGNSINHINSYLVTSHGPRVFVKGEVDMVAGVGYNPARRTPGMRGDFIDLRRIVTDLCVLDFEGPQHAMRVRSLHPGVHFDDVQAATGFELLRAPEMGVTPLPDATQLDIIRRLDPHNLRASALRNNPPALRAAPRAEVPA
ncbi:CoA-transferase subunit beta [Noviherbaspirillum saxi]|uniref:Ketoacid CoA transferase n=1 Tax=Noviherbaspirillum saxi TaxID=2320863 RepID=A0A3A3FM54_9BURK|nr:ketoacid CoA transferase [Noviherbaspirillum saxi]RJF92612.1 ketoacid CoA transferase [Noviherbaspirillum saxi]